MLRYLEIALTQLVLPVIYVSHSLAEVRRLSEHLVWLADGRAVDAGPTSQMLSRLDFAQWRGEEPGAVLEGTIRDHDDDFALTTVTTSLGDLTVHRRSEARGDRVQLQINARDVSLGLSAQTTSSILNELQLTVIDILELSPSDCLVRLGRPHADGPTLLARITRKSTVQLRLETGQDVFARVKSVAVLD